MLLSLTRYEPWACDIFVELVVEAQTETMFSALVGDDCISKFDFYPTVATIIYNKEDDTFHKYLLHFI